MSLRVLVVDDNKTFAAAVRRLLERVTGIEIAGQAFNGAEALDLLSAAVPDVLLLDVAMPGMGGLELARLVRERWPGVHILVMSMHDNVGYREAAGALDAEFVTKSNFVDGLLPLLEKLVAQRGEVGA